MKLYVNVGCPKKSQLTFGLCVRHDRKVPSFRANQKPKVAQKMKLKPMAQFITSGWNQRRKKERSGCCVVSAVLTQNLLLPAAFSGQPEQINVSFLGKTEQLCKVINLLSTSQPEQLKNSELRSLNLGSYFKVAGNVRALCSARRMQSVGMDKSQIKNRRYKQPLMTGSVLSG